MNADDRTVLINELSNARLRQASSFSDKDVAGRYWRSGLKIRLNCLCVRVVAMVSIALLPPCQIGRFQSVQFSCRSSEFQRSHITYPTTRIQEQVEDCICSNVLTQFDFTQQAPHVFSFQPFRGQLLTLQLLDCLGGIRFESWSCSTSQPKKRRSVTKQRFTVLTA